LTHRAPQGCERATWGEARHRRAVRRSTGQRTMMPHLAGSQHRVAPATVIGPAVVSGMALAGPPCPAAFPSTKPSP